MFERDIEQGQGRSRVIGFCLVYGEGKFFAGRTESDWKRAPKENVQLLLLYLDELTHMGVPYREAVSGWDYYSYDGSRYTCSNDTRTLCTGDIKYGWWTTDRKWVELTKWALQEIKAPGGVLDANR